MRDIDVVYLYENVARELDVACAVTALLRQRHGLSVHIVQWPQSVATLYGRITPRAVVLPFCYFEHSFDCLLEWRQATFVNLSWEQLFYRGNVQRKTPRGTFATQHVLHHAWSEGYADFARRQSIPDKYIYVNGQPAYALYDEPYRRYFAPRSLLASRHALDGSKPWVFFPENYNWAFYGDFMLDAFLRAGQTVAEVQEMRTFCAESFREVMQWFGRLAQTGTVELIVRPRPSTPLNDFRAAVEEVLPDIPGSMHIIQEETVREWIMASDVVLSSHSTSLIEAAVAGRPAYMVAPFEIPASLRQEWHALVPRLETEQELVRATLMASPGRQHAGLERWSRATFMAKGDAIQNLADYIAQVVKGKVERPPVPSRLCATAQGDRLQVPKWIWFVFRRLRARFRRIVRSRPDATRFREIVGAEEIDRRVARWEGLLADAARHVDGPAA
jgi:surface carbohydrate biosynthesis protein